MPSLELVGRCDFGAGPVSVNIDLHQGQDCAVVANFTTATPVLGLIPDELFIEGVHAASGLELPRSEAHVTNTNECFSAKGGSTTVEVFLAKATLSTKVQPASTDLVDCRFYLANMPYFRRFRNGILLTVDGITLTVSPHDDGKITGIAEARSIPFGEFDRVVAAIRDVCWLTTFAGGTLTVVARTEVVWKDAVVFQEYRSPDTTLDRDRLPVVYDLNPWLSDYTSFIHNAFLPYRRYASTYRLESLIHVGVLAKHNDYREVKTLLMVNFLEVLRNSYAASVAVPAGVFTQNNDDFRWSAGPNAGKRATFFEIIEHFCSSIGLSGWNPDYKDVRNEIVHTGTVAGRNSLQRYFDLHHFCDRVILALLEWDTVHGYYIPINCPNDPTPGVQGANRVSFQR